MQPAVRDLPVYRGDNLALLYRLWAMVDDALAPLDVAGVAWTLTIGTLVKSTADASLVLTADGSVTSLAVELTPAETEAIQSGALVSLVRAGGPRGRRTYLTGRATVSDLPQPGQGDLALDLTVTDDDLVVDVTVNDTYAENLLAIARAEIAAVDRRAFAYALIFG